MWGPEAYIYIMSRVLLTHVYWFRVTGGYICGCGRPSNLVCCESYHMPLWRGRVVHANVVCICNFHLNHETPTLYVIVCIIRLYTLKCVVFSEWRGGIYWHRTELDNPRYNNNYKIAYFCWMAVWGQHGKISY